MRKAWLFGMMLLTAIAALFAIGVGTGRAAENVGKTTEAADKATEAGGETTTITIGSEKIVSCEQATRGERMKCRLSLPSEVVRKVTYLPEECRENDDKQACLEQYRFFQQCQNEGTDAKRMACMKPKLNISGTVHSILQTCEGKNGTQRAECVQQIGEAVIKLVKFRMYNLEYKIEELRGMGLGEDKAAEMMAKVQEAKIAFDQAETTAAKIEVVKRLKADWEEFISDASAELGRKPDGGSE